MYKNCGQNITFVGVRHTFWQWRVHLEISSIELYVIRKMKYNLQSLVYIFIILWQTTPIQNIFSLKMYYRYYINIIICKYYFTIFFLGQSQRGVLDPNCNPLGTDPTKLRKFSTKRIAILIHKAYLGLVPKENCKMKRAWENVVSAFQVLFL